MQEIRDPELVCRDSFCNRRKTNFREKTGEYTTNLVKPLDLYPYLVGESGGGAYVLTFIAVMMLVGIPIILVENVIGRRAQANSVDAFALAGRAPGYSPSPLWKLFGYTGLLGAFGILAYYMVIGGWVISYIWHIFLGAAGVAGGLDLSSPPMAALAHRCH